MGLLGSGSLGHFPSGETKLSWGPENSFPDRLSSNYHAELSIDIVNSVMPKRSWSQVEGVETQPARRLSGKGASKAHQVRHIKTDSPDAGLGETTFYLNGSYPDTHPPTPILTDAASESRSAKTQGSRQRAPSSIQSDNEPAAWPSITRKVKACAACRKQKIKCDMEDDGPPCKRCKERNLSCKLNKSLQTLIDEESRSVADDLSKSLALTESSDGGRL